MFVKNGLEISVSSTGQGNAANITIAEAKGFGWLESDRLDDRATHEIGNRSWLERLDSEFWQRGTGDRDRSSEEMQALVIGLFINRYEFGLAI